MHTKKKIRKAFEAVKPDVLSRVLEDCPADVPKKAAPAPMMPQRHWLKELAATAAALALLIGVAAGGVLYFRDLRGSGTGVSPDPTTAPTVIGNVPMVVPPQTRVEILAMLEIDGAEIEIVPGIRGEYFTYAVDHNGFSFVFVYDSFDQFAFVELASVSGDGLLPISIAKQLLQQHLSAEVDTEPADPQWGPQVINGGELLKLDVGDFYRFLVSLNPAMSYCPSYYVDALNGQIHLSLPETETPPVEEPWDAITARDKALLAVHLSIEEVYYLKGEFPANEDGAYYIRWTIKSEKGSYNINQGKNYQTLEVFPLYFDSVPPFDGEMPYPWDKALHIALEDAGVRLEDVSGLDCRYSDQNAWYNILFTIDGLNHIYTVSAKDGSIYEKNTVDLTHIISAQEALDLVTRQSELPAALKNAVLSGEAGVTCTLTNEQVDPVYDVQLLWKDDFTGYTCHARVHATTGAIVYFRAEETPHGTDTPIGPTELTSANVAEHTIVNLFGFSMDESHVLGIEVSPEHYVVEFLAAGCHYKVTVDAASGERIHHEAEDQYDTLEQFNAAFGDQTGYYNRALTDYYDDPTQLSLSALFANAPTDSWAMPDVEWYDAWFATLPEDEKAMDHHFVPRELMDQVLQAYFGIRLTDLPAESYAGLTYIDLIGWYSIVANDFNVTEQFRAVGMAEQENGNIRLYYTCNGSNDLQVVTLRVTHNANTPWQIVSNEEHIPYMMIT